MLIPCVGFFDFCPSYPLMTPFFLLKCRSPSYLSIPIYSPPDAVCSLPIFQVFHFAQTSLPFAHEGVIYFPRLDWLLPFSSFGQSFWSTLRGSFHSNKDFPLRVSTSCNCVLFFFVVLTCKLLSLFFFPEQ